MAIEVVKTIRATGGDYSTYNGFVTGEGRDLVTADEIAVAEVYNDWANGGLSTSSPAVLSSSNSWVTGEDNPVIFRAAPGHRHNGRPLDSNGYYTGANLATNSTNGYSLLTFFARFEGLILRSTAGSASARYLMSTTITTSGGKPNNLLTFDSCLFGNTSTNSASSCIRAQGRRDVVAANCVAFDGGVGFFFCDHAQSNAWILNCTAVGMRAKGLTQSNSSGTAVLINCLASGSAAVDFDNINSATVENCAASDASLPVGNGNRNSQTFTFEDAANLDFRLTAEDEGALGLGQDLSAYSPYPFSVDALGLSRSAPWDIGAFRTITGSPPTGDTTISLAAITDDGIVLDVDDSGVSDADGYEYQLGTVGPWATLTAETVTGLDPLADYQVRVAPVNAHGRGAASNLVSFRTLASTTIYNKQSHAAAVGTITGTEITLPGGVTHARTYAIHRAPGGTWAVHALHEDWEAASQYLVDLAPGSASGIGSDLSVSYGYIAQLVAGEASGIGVDLTLTSGAVVPYTEAIQPGSAHGLGVDLTLTAGAVIDYGVDLIPGSASGLGVNLTLVSGDVVPYQVAIDAGLSDGLGVDLSLSAGYRSAVEVGQAQGVGVDASLIQGLSVDIDPGHADGLGVNLSLIAGDVQPYSPQVAPGASSGVGQVLALSAGYAPRIEAGVATGIGIGLALTQGYLSSVIAGAAHGIGVEMSMFTGNILGPIRRPSTRDVLSTLSTRPA